LRKVWKGSVKGVLDVAMVSRGLVFTVEAYELVTYGQLWGYLVGSGGEKVGGCGVRCMAETWLD
jgi:hypothetical protein